MHSLSLIQTNHGVSYPLVGPQRLKQSELGVEDDTPARSSAVVSPRPSAYVARPADRVAAFSPQEDKNSPMR